MTTKKPAAKLDAAPDAAEVAAQPDMLVVDLADVKGPEWLARYLPDVAARADAAGVDVAPLIAIAYAAHALASHPNGLSTADRDVYRLHQQLLDVLYHR